MKNIDIIRTPNGGIEIKVIAKHGPGDIHTISLPRDEWSTIKRQIANYHDALHRASGPRVAHLKEPFMLGLETLDADLIDLRHNPSWSDTEIVTGSEPPRLDGPLEIGCSCGGEENEEDLKGL